MRLNISAKLGLDRKVLLILTAALALRLGYGLSVPGTLFHADAQAFDSLAWNLAETGQYGVGRPTAVRPPAYVFFLAGIYGLAGHSAAAVRAVQAVMGTLLVWMLIRISLRLSGAPLLPLLAGWLAALYPFLVYYEAQLLSDAFLTFWTVLSLFSFIRWKEEPSSWWRACVCGLAFSVTSLTKTPMLAWAAAVIAAEAFFMSRRGGGPSAVPRLFALTLAFALPLLAWGARNKKELGAFTIDNHGGFTLVSTIIYHAQTKAGVFAENVREDPFFLHAARLPEPEQESYYYGAARRFVMDNPGRYLRECLVRFKDLWRFYPRPDVRFREGTSRLILISLLTEPFLIAAGLFALFVLRPAWRLMYPAPLAVLWLTLLHSLITGQMRYRLPLMPMLILGAAYAAVRWKNRVPTERS